MEELELSYQGRRGQDLLGLKVSACWKKNTRYSKYKSFVSVEVMQNADCIALMEGFIADQPGLWNEDIGE